MAPSFLNHRLLIDDYTTLLTTPSAVNAFNFTTPGWKSHPLYTGNFDDTVTEFNRNDSSNLEILVKFVGTSVYAHIFTYAANEPQCAQVPV